MLRLCPSRTVPAIAAALLVFAGRSPSADATPIADLTPAERAAYYPNLLRDLQNLGGEHVTDELLVRAGPCLEQCPRGFGTFTLERVDWSGFAPKRDIHYDREAVAIRTRDEKIHDALIEWNHEALGLQERTFEVVNSELAASLKLLPYCGGGHRFGIEAALAPVNGEVWVLKPNGPVPEGAAEQRALRDRWLAYAEACEFKKLDLYPSELQLVRLEDFLGLKRKLRGAVVGGAVTRQQVQNIHDNLAAIAATLRERNDHPLAQIIATALDNIFTLRPADFEIELLRLRMLEYMYDGAQYMATLTDLDSVEAYDELGLVYEHMQDLIYTYQAWDNDYPTLADFQRVATAQAIARNPPPDDVGVLTYPVQSGMDGFGLAYVAAQRAVGSDAVGDSSYPATARRLGTPVLGMRGSMYFETRFKPLAENTPPIWGAGLATEFDFSPVRNREQVIDLAKEITSSPAEKRVLIIDDTLVAFDDPTRLPGRFYNTTGMLINALSPLIRNGTLDIILVRSLQKYGSLATRKVKAGLVTVYTTDPRPYAVLQRTAGELYATRGRDFQFIAFNLEFQDRGERLLIKRLHENAAALTAVRRYPDDRQQLSVRAFMLTSELELRAQAFRSMPQFGTFGGPYTSHSDLGDVERFSPGLEPRDVLFEKLRFATTNVPLGIRLLLFDGPRARYVSVPFLDDRYPAPGHTMTNDAFYEAAGAALLAGLHDQAPLAFDLYQTGRRIPRGEGEFNFDFSRPGQPVYVYVVPRAE